MVDALFAKLHRARVAGALGEGRTQQGPDLSVFAELHGGM